MKQKKLNNEIKRKRKYKKIKSITKMEINFTIVPTNLNKNEL